MSTTRKGLKQSKEVREKIRIKVKGHKHSIETLLKMSAAKLGSKYSEETRQKMSTKKNKAVIVTDLHTNIIKEYISQKMAAFALGIGVVTIRKYIYLGKP